MERNTISIKLTREQMIDLATQLGERRVDDNVYVIVFGDDGEDLYLKLIESEE